jgi:hypothetical protein
MASLIQVLLSVVTSITFFIIYFITGSFTLDIGIFGNFFINLGLVSIIIGPITAFFTTITLSYFSLLVYNFLTPRLGGIKFKLLGNEITHIPVISMALSLSIIVAVWAAIIGLYLGLILAVLNLGISPTFNELTLGFIPTITNAINTTLPPIAGLGGAFTLIIGLPIMAFILSFIDIAIIVLLYNYVGSRAAYLQLNLEKLNRTTYLLKSIPAGPITIVAGVISGVLGLLIFAISLLGFIDLVNLASAGKIIGIVLSRDEQLIYLIPYILIAALVAIFYNLLVRRISGIKLKIE